jgi:hypothetical protein
VGVRLRPAMLARQAEHTGHLVAAKRQQAARVLPARAWHRYDALDEPHTGRERVPCQLPQVRGDGIYDLVTSSLRASTSRYHFFRFRARPGHAPTVPLSQNCCCSKRHRGGNRAQPADLNGPQSWPAPRASSGSACTRKPRHAPHGTRTPSRVACRPGTLASGASVPPRRHCRAIRDGKIAELNGARGAAPRRPSNLNRSRLNAGAGAGSRGARLGGSDEPALREAMRRGMCRYVETRQVALAVLPVRFSQEMAFLEIGQGDTR